MDGTHIRALRESAGLSQMNVAKTAGITQSYLSRFERQEAQPDGATISNIERAIERLVNERNERIKSILSTPYAFACATERYAPIP